MSRIVHFGTRFRRAAGRLGVVPGSARGRIVGKMIGALAEAEALPGPGDTLALLPPGAWLDLCIPRGHAAFDHHNPQEYTPMTMHRLKPRVTTHGGKRSTGKPRAQSAPAAKSREQLAEILAEGDAPHQTPIPSSHAALIDERAALIDAGRMELISSDEAHARLMAVAQANLLEASGARPRATKRAAAKAPGAVHKPRRPHKRKSR